jgi:hypothetical protein
MSTADNATKEGRQKNRRMEATFDCVIKKLVRKKKGRLHQAVLFRQG